ncbi:MAG: hypothetical protein QG592_463 [Pseudomonadota bacterium]|nr:hypothetical protein [Pseudomonadota bacterium]
MGNTWVVQSWLPDDLVPNKYAYVEIYRGQSWLAATMAAIREKRRYSLGCIKIEWR